MWCWRRHEMDNWQQTVPSQYANSPTLMQLLANWNVYIDPSTNIDSFYDLVWNVDTAQGYGLDVWGRIVGVGRVLAIETVNYLGLEDPSSSGASGVALNEGPLYNGGQLTTNYTLEDGPYRGLILAKAAYNICFASIPAINQIIIDIFGPDGPFPISGNSYCTDGGDMTMTYTFGSSLDPVQTAVVTQSGVLPRPCGVSVTVVT